MVKVQRLFAKTNLKIPIYITAFKATYGLSFSFEKFADLSGLSENVVVLFVLPERENI